MKLSDGRFLLPFGLSLSACLWVALGDPPAPARTPGIGAAPTPVPLTYGTPVTLRGRIVEQTFPGRPNYESIAHGDHADALWFLMLDRPISVPGKVEDPPDMEGANFADLIQMVLTEEQRKRYHRFQPRFKTTTFEVTGKLHHSSHGNERTPVIVWTEAVTLVKDAE